MSQRDEGDDRRLTYGGDRGPAFRKFLRDFKSIARGKFARDDRYSFMSCYDRKDEGGTHANAPAMPGAAAQLAAAQVKRQIRHGQAYTFLYESQTNESIRQMLSDLADTDPNELPADALDLIIRECDEPSDDLELSKMDLE